MRILMLSQFYPPVTGGEEHHVRNLSIALAERGHEVHVGTFQLGAEHPEPDHPAVRVHPLRNTGRHLGALYASADRPLALPVPDPLVTADLRRLTGEIQPDVVHAHNWIVNSYLPIRRRVPAPLVVSLHDYGNVCATKRFMRGDQPCAGPAPRRCLPCVTGHYGPVRGPAIWGAVRTGLPIRNRLIDRFTPVSQAVATASGLATAEVDWEVVPNFVPDRLLQHPVQPRDRDLPRVPYLFFAGDLSAQKGLLTLLRAYERLPADRPPLVVVGRPTPDVPARLPDGVQLHRGWSHERIISGFQHSLAAVLPSEWPDPCPTTVLEAMALGASLVTTHQGGIADMVVAEESALVVQPGDVAALAAALTRITGDTALRTRLRQHARERVLGFLQSTVADRFTTIYAALARKAHHV